MTPRRIQLSRRKGFKLPENAVNVARPGRYGNPFVVGRDGTRAECVELYRRLAEGLECLTSGATHTDQMRARAAMEAAKAGALRGRDLACWCPLPKPGEPDICHAAVLLEISNQLEAK